jgi:hypothetical protein
MAKNTPMVKLTIVSPRAWAGNVGEGRPSDRSRPKRRAAPPIAALLLFAIRSVV